MRPTVRQYAEALEQATVGCQPGQIKEALGRFVKILAARGDLKKAPLIIERFEEIQLARAGQATVTVTTARELDESGRKLLGDYLQSRLPDKKVVWQRCLEPAILGGAIISYGSRLVDFSLKDRLVKLKNNLIK